jgi:hypothetical protein
MAVIPRFYRQALILMSSQRHQKNDAVSTLETIRLTKETISEKFM